MNARLIFALLATALLASPAAFAKEKAKPDDDRPPLALVVVDNLQRNWGGAITGFDRLEMAFDHIDGQRKWPMRVVAERFAANMPHHETELRVFLQPIRDESPGELVFRSWVTLTVNEKKHDFGIVLFRYYPRAGESVEDTLTKMFRGAAAIIADKVEPVLFPKAGTAKP